MSSPQPALTSMRVFAIAIPVALSNATAPLQGIVDVAAMGRFGALHDVGGVGLGAEIFALLLVPFNFLQLSASGLSAQALGSGDRRRVAHVLLRAGILALIVAALLMMAQWPLRIGVLALFEASDAVEDAAARYFQVRIWAAPAELLNYALMGWFAGQERIRALVIHQISVTALNIPVTVTLVAGLGMGVEGAAWGTLAAQYGGLMLGCFLALRRLRVIAGRDWRPDWARVMRRSELLAMMALNRDIFIRTILLTGAFAWMMRLGAGQGDEILGANVLLWQFFIFSAFMLDGFAIAAETLVGQAAGARHPRNILRAAWLSGVWCQLLALAATLVFALSAGMLIDAMTDLPDLRAAARDYALWAAITPFVGAAAFIMDGVFVGGGAGRDLRNAMIISAGVYFPASALMVEHWGNHGLWAATHLFLLLRGVTLMLRLPAMARGYSSPL